MLDGFLCLLNLNTYKDGIDIRAPHLDHFLQKDLNLRDLISETTLHKRVIGQHNLHYNLIATVMVVHLLTTADTDIAELGIVPEIKALELCIIENNRHRLVARQASLEIKAVFVADGRQIL